MYDFIETEKLFFCSYEFQISEKVIENKEQISDQYGFNRLFRQSIPGVTIEGLRMTATTFN